MVALIALTAALFGAEQGALATSEKPAKPIIVEGSRKVCHEEVSTGSILRKRVCKTVDQFDRQRAASQHFADQKGRELTTYQQMQIVIARPKDSP